MTRVNKKRTLTSAILLAWLALCNAATTNAGVSDGTVDSEQKISDTAGSFGGTLDNSDSLGTSAASLGLLDGDAVPDVAIGATGDDDGGSDRGAVWILFLNSDGTVKAEQKISDTAGTFTGTLDNDDLFGSSLANIGDLDNDGNEDLAVGAIGDDDGGTDRGAVWILFLNSDGTVKAEQKISDTAGTFTGTLDNDDLFGSSLAGIGDLDSDGNEDLAVGAIGDDDGGTDRGAVWILFLNSDGTVKAEQKISDTAGTFTGTLDNEDLFGSSLADLGDLNGGGVGDLAVGAREDDDGAGNAGAVWILFLKTDGTVDSEQKISASTGGFGGSISKDDLFGASATGVTDLDGDGIDDLVVGASRDNSGGKDTGAIWVLFLNTDGTVDSEQKIANSVGGFGGSLANDSFFGSAVTSAGDLDANGAADLTVGTPGDGDGGSDRGALWNLFLDVQTNLPPVCSAGGPYTTDCQDAAGTVVLDGSGSSDPEAGLLTYAWTSDCPGASFDDATSATPVLTLTSTPGSLPVACSVMLTVTDDQSEETSCSADVTVVDTTIPTVTCPAATTVSADAACLALVPDVTAGVVTSDNCTATGDLTITQDPLAGTSLGPGTHTITVTVTDADGNSADCTTDLTIEDTTEPTVTCPPALSIAANGSSQAAIPDLTASATALDNCAAAMDITISQNPVPGTLVGLGTHTVTVTATDADGNSADCTTDVTVVDVCDAGGPYNTTCQSGLASVMLDGSGSNDPGGAGLTYLWTSDCPGASFDDPTSVTPTLTITTGASAFPLVCSVALTVTSGVQQYPCSATVTVTDATAPSIIACPTATTIAADTSCQAMLPDITGAAVATDNCAAGENIVITQNPTAGTLLGIATHPVAVTATDLAGNSTVCNTSVTIVDGLAPSITCPADMTLECTDSAGAIASFSATAVDTCDPEPVVTCVPPPESVFPFGTTAVTCTATDATGNFSTCVFSVTVVDTTPPSIVCPGETSVMSDGLEGATVDFTTTATDTCDDTPSVTCVPPSGSRFPVGTTSVTCTAVDSQGNSSTCDFDVVVHPTITRGPYLQMGGMNTMTVVWQTDGPADGVVEYGTTGALGSSASDPASPSNTHVVELNGLGTYTDYVYRVSSNGNVLSQNTTFRTFPPGNFDGPFRVAAWGDSGSETQAQFNVAARLEALAPDLAIHTGDLIYNNGEPELYNPRYFAPYEDLIDRVVVYPTMGNHDVRTDNGQPFVDAFYLPNNERYYSFDYANVHFTGVDTTLPFDSTSAQYSWLQQDLAATSKPWIIVFHHHTPYTTSFSHSNDPENALIKEHLAPLYDMYGVDIVLLGHTHAFERTYPVNGDAVVFDCQDPDYLNPGGTFYVTTGGGGRSLRPQDESHPNTAYNAVYEKRYHATTLDFDGDTITVRAVADSGTILDEFTLRKTPDGGGQDVEPPVINCPPDISLECVGADGATADYEATATDDCDPAPVLQYDIAPGSLFPLGTTTVACTAIDSLGNSSSCTFTVTVEDTTEPNLVCPASTTVPADESTLQAAIPDLIGDATADDLCSSPGSLVITQDPSPGTMRGLGAHMVTLTATDPAGNSQSCQTTVTVADSNAPVITCPQNLTAECEGTDGAAVSFTATAVDSGDPNPLVVCVPASGSTFPLGVTDVTCTATDVAQNSTSCMFTVEVADTTPPVLVCSPDLDASCTGPSGAVVEYSTTATDDCDPSPVLECDVSSGSTFPLGTTLVSCTATDASGNSSSCSFSVRVDDPTPLTITCPSEITIAADASCAGTVPDLRAMITTSPNCTPPEDLVFTQSLQPGAIIELADGSPLVRIDVNDLAGTTASCETTVVVVDTEVPTVTCPEDMTISCTSLSGQVVEFSATAEDLCGTIPTVTCTPPSGSVFPIGTTTVTCTATDGAGNTATCTFDITLEGVGVEIPDMLPQSSTTAEVEANLIGVEPSVAIYRWELLSGDCIFIGETNQETVEISPDTADVDCAVRVTANLEECGAFTDEQTVQFRASGGGQVPGDCNQDGELDISDGICLLSFLFLSNAVNFPCEPDVLQAPANKSLLDTNGDDGIDLSDAISVFSFLFLGEDAPVLGTVCVPIFGCPETCGA